MSKLLTTAASAALLLAATGAYANDMHGDKHHNAGQNATIQKSESASTKAYGYNKQGDHYSTREAYRDEWNASNAYPGDRRHFGTQSSVVIKKGGSGISDASSEAATRQYGTYWN